MPGGSYYEEPQWWKKPRYKSRISKFKETLKEMLKEMLFMRQLFLHHRRLWYISYAMHLGIYMLIIWTLFLIAGALTEIIARGSITSYGAGFWAGLVYYGTVITGTLGALLLLGGSAGLFLRRAFSSVLRKYSTGLDYFNLLFIFAVALSGLVVRSTDPAFHYGRMIMKGLLTLSPIRADTALAIHIILLGSLLIYIPLSKLNHYVGKYFAFHKVLWDNEPNLRHSRMEEKVKMSLSYKPKVFWSAPHTRPDGVNQDEK